MKKFIFPFVIILILGVFYFLIPVSEETVDWETTKRLNTVRGYDQFADKYNETEISIEPFRERAFLDELDDASVHGFIEYFNLYTSDGTYYDEFVAKFKSFVILKDSFELYIYFVNSQSIQELDKSEILKLADINLYKEVERSENWNRYLLNFPQGTYASIVRENYEAASWNICLNSYSAHDIKFFITNFPNSEHIPKALEKHDNLLWNDAMNANTIESYNYYLKEALFPQYASKARKKIEEMEWNYVVNSNSVSSYEIYIKENPNSSFINEAENNLENLYWKEIIQKGFPLSLESATVFNLTPNPLIYGKWYISKTFPLIPQMFTFKENNLLGIGLLEWNGVWLMYKNKIILSYKRLEDPFFLELEITKLNAKELHLRCISGCGEKLIFTK